jgi:hypothetical protein
VEGRPDHTTGRSGAMGLVLFVPDTSDPQLDSVFLFCSYHFILGGDDHAKQN